MESSQALRGRLKSIKNVGQITKAMEVVAATKMRRAQEAALASRPYAFSVLDLLSRLTADNHLTLPLTQRRPVESTALVLLSSDRGLAGSFNSQLFRLADRFLTGDLPHIGEDHHYELVPVGKKALGYARTLRQSLRGRNFVGESDVPVPAEAIALANYLIAGFENNRWQRVVVISTHFHTALKQEALVRELLPLSPAAIRQTVAETVPEAGRYAEKVVSPLAPEPAATDYLFEPGREEVLDELLPHLVRMQVYHLFLEAKASEHSARRVAMKTASDNARDLADSLTIALNKSRQVGITRELAEITTTINTLTT